MKLSVAVAPSLRLGAPIPLQGPLDWAFREASEAGYQGVELQISHPRDLEKYNVSSLLRDNGLDVACIATGAAFIDDGLCLSDVNESRRKAAVTRITEHCLLAAELSTAVVIGMMRGKLSSNLKEADYQKKAFLASLGECSEIAAGMSVGLMLEPINRYETNFLPTVESALALIDDNGLTNITLVLDTFHMNIEEPSIDLAFLRARGRIGLVQLVDTNRHAPGMGHLDVAAVVATLYAGGYDGFLSLESLPFPSGRRAIQHAVAFLHQLDQDLFKPDSSSGF